MAVIGINYEDGSKKKDLGYESVYVYTNEFEKIFGTGNFIKDWFEANKFVSMDESMIAEMHVAFSSTVDHFQMDGDEFKSAYLKFTKDDEPYLEYYESGKFDLSDLGQEFFVKKGETPTWQELKGYCK